jgi:hypothetical protein
LFMMIVNVSNVSRGEIWVFIGHQKK